VSREIRETRVFKVK
jgi:hypothetical protein